MVYNVINPGRCVKQASKLVAIIDFHRQNEICRISLRHLGYSLNQAVDRHRGDLSSRLGRPFEVSQDEIVRALKVHKSSIID